MVPANVAITGATGTLVTPEPSTVLTALLGAAILLILRKGVAPKNLFLSAASAPSAPLR